MAYPQRGYHLGWTAVCAGLFALVAMAALFSWRYERNLFAEAWTAVAGEASGKVAAVAREAVSSAPPTGPLRRCTIKGKTVISNTDCSDQNPTSQDVSTQYTRGIEAPKAPPKEAPAPTSNPVLDKMIEKQMH